eukprot:13962431-Heterocapsa_arctica.AAC.1
MGRAEGHQLADCHQDMPLMSGTMRHRAQKEPGSWMSPNKAHWMVPRHPSRGEAESCSTAE